MSDDNAAAAAAAIQDDENSPIIKSNRQMLLVIYILFAIGLVTGGLAGLVGVIMSHLKRADCAGTWLDSHHRWLQRTFWFGLLWAVVSIATWVFILGIVLAIATSIWTIYRIVRGFLAFNDGKPMYQ